jgi:outer membrane protein assembly factor BamD (BamD/ComL family)
VKGSMKVLVDAYRDLHMMDLASNAERVYADNYPGDTKDILRKKHWWAIF